jgi:broad specificity phosphatase PhoE
LARLILVRHGRAAAGWDSDHDPGLDDTGRAQAEAMALSLAARGPLPIVSSPLKRARETAAALERRWGTEAVFEATVGEIPSPTSDLAERGRWLRQVLEGTWSAAPADVVSWRTSVLEWLTTQEADAVIVTHYVLINVGVGAATKDDRLVCFHPDNCSITELDVAEGTLSVVQLGDQAVTTVR